jgi:diaminopimelate epimerase
MVESEKRAVKIKFSKMHGNGNDFVVIDAVRQRLALSAEQVRFLADRHLGVGCDQVLVVEAPTRADADFRYRIFNADGGEVEHCGNGARCFMKFVRDQGLTAKDEIRVETKAGIISPRFADADRVTVNMGVPRFEPKDVPFDAPQRQLTYALSLEDATLQISVLSLGNPHAVQIVEDVQSAPVASQGPRIERHRAFPARVNAGFMQVLDRGHIKLRVWERGAGETLACGTGACAAVVAGRMRGLLDETVRVATRGGELLISWTKEGEPVWLTGNAKRVFEAEINL